VFSPLFWRAVGDLKIVVRVGRKASPRDPALTFSLLLVAPVAVEAVKQFGPLALG
jgi:hypothetical protein